MKTKVLILGSGGHAKVLIDCLNQQPEIEILGMVDIDPSRTGQQILGVTVLGTEAVIQNYSCDVVSLVNGVGSITLPKNHEQLFHRFKAQGFSFLSVIHPSAIVAADVVLGEGAQLMARAVIQPGTVIGDNVIINTSVAIDHDCQIGGHVHVAPGVVCSGGVTIGAFSHIGTGAVIIQNISIGKHCLVAAGAVVANEVPDHSKAIGVPARTVSEKIS